MKNLRIHTNPLIGSFLKCLGESVITSSDSFIKLLPQSWRHPEASWRQMLILQPSVEIVVEFYLAKHIGSQWLDHNGTKDMASGTTTLGGLADWLDKMYASGQSREKAATIELLLRN